jgi:4-carboxymuconolactone decarboxylase
LRREAAISPRIREIAIMTTAREFDSLFEWNAHEPEGLKEGVPPTVVDAIKNRKALDGPDPTDAVVIQFGRELWRDHKVTSRDLRQGQGSLWAQQAGRSRHADGQLRQHGRTADRLRHADT